MPSDRATHRLIAGGFECLAKVVLWSVKAHAHPVGVNQKMWATAHATVDHFINEAQQIIVDEDNNAR